MATDKQKAFVRLAIMEGIVLHKDWHSLNSTMKDKVSKLCKAYGYKKSPNCTNSLSAAGNFYYLLSKTDAQRIKKSLDEKNKKSLK